MSATSANNQSPPHILIFPYPAQGHTLPLLDLTHHLSFYYNFTITIITTPKNLLTLSPLLSSSPNIHPLIFPFPSHHSLPPGVENVRDLGDSGNRPIILALTNLFHPISQWFHSQRDPPVALISDFFLGWTHHLASHLNIPRFAFFSSGALLTTVNDYCWTHLEAVKKFRNVVVEFPDLPGTPSFEEKHLPAMFRSYKESDPDYEVLKDGVLANTNPNNTYGCIFNTFEALEGNYLEYLKTKILGHKRVYGVGPVSLIGLVHSNRGEPVGDADSSKQVFSWLDGCPESSVLYVCFGSQKEMSDKQMEALASGLERSMTRFVWVVNTRLGSASVPDGFEERVRERGMVIKGWAPQVRILSHGAVGGFLNHCGWNSVLEGIAAGVVILAWPMGADQFVNAKLLVEELGLGVRVWEGGDSVPDSDQLAKVISESMGCGKRKEMAKTFKDKALGAVGVGGSSLDDVDRLAKDLLGLGVEPGQTLLDLCRDNKV